GAVVTKSYQGQDAERRCSREAAILRALAGKLPVPPLIANSGSTVTMGFMRGVHGQDLVAAGLASAVLRACGPMLCRIQAIDPAAMTGAAGVGAVLVHGDYGPNNVLLDPVAEQVTAIVDWEWVHAGDPVEDLAWCEWIMRMHHPGYAGAIGGLFGGYGYRPSWAVRHQAMVSRCQYYSHLAERHEPGGDVALRWQNRLRITQGWSE
ncbi:MAG: phosphotransferase, partial [Actinomycetota bacterium]